MIIKSRNWTKSHSDSGLPAFTFRRISECGYTVLISLLCGLIVSASLSKYVIVVYYYFNYPHMPSSLAKNSEHLFNDEKKTAVKYYNKPYVIEPTYSVPHVHARTLTDEHLDLLERGWEGMDIEIRWIGVLSSPLEDIYQSSHASVSEILRRVWTGGDYHAFIVFYTSDGMFWALDKDREGIHLSWCTVLGYDPIHTVMKCRDSKTLRAAPITILSQASSYNQTYPVKKLSYFLREELSRTYGILSDNCQDFSSRLINEVTQTDVWQPIPKLHLLFSKEFESNALVLLEVLVELNLIILVLLGNIRTRRKAKCLCIAYITWITSPSLYNYDVPMEVALKLDDVKLKELTHLCMASVENLCICVSEDLVAFILIYLISILDSHFRRSRIYRTLQRYEKFFDITVKFWVALMLHHLSLGTPSMIVFLFPFWFGILLVVFSVLVTLAGLFTTSSPHGPLTLEGAGELVILGAWG